MALTEDEIDDILYAARVNEPTELGQYLAESAKRLGKAESKFEILSAAADAESGNTALHYAAANGHTDIIALASTLITGTTELEATGAPALEARDATLSPAQSERLQPFLDRANGAGNTALHWAALNGHLGAVQLLVKLGANPALTNNMGHDAVFEAERNDKEEVVKWFLAEVPGLEQAVGGGEEDETPEAGEDMDVDRTGANEADVQQDPASNGFGST